MKKPIPTISKIFLFRFFVSSIFDFVPFGWLFPIVDFYPFSRESTTMRSTKSESIPSSISPRTLDLRGYSYELGLLPMQQSKKNQNTQSAKLIMMIISDLMAFIYNRPYFTSESYQTSHRGGIAARRGDG
jgi:hypothetical protein